MFIVRPLFYLKEKKMASANVKNTLTSLANAQTFQGAPAEIPQDAYKRLLRQACNCMLFENTYYQPGTEIANEIRDTALELPTYQITEAAMHITEHFKLRSVSVYLLALAIVKRDLNKDRVDGGIIEDAAKKILSRPDMLTELFVLYQKLTGGDKTFPKVLHRIASERMKFYTVYQIGKYASRGGLTLRDVLRIAHVKPQTPEREQTFKAIVNQTLEVPATWEKRLSAGEDKKTTWETMLREGTIGGLAVLKNLRNMIAVNVDPQLIRQTLAHVELFRGALITQILAANIHSKNMFSTELSRLFQFINIKPLNGKTVFLVDVSGSMDNNLANNSELTLMQASSVLAAVGSGVCEDSQVYSFSASLLRVPYTSAYPFTFADEICKSQSHYGTNLESALKELNTTTEYDRLIILTDEQTSSPIPAALNNKCYIINVAAYKQGIQTQLRYQRIDGFSPSIFQFINEKENIND